MELLLLLLLPALLSGVLGSGGDDDTPPEEEPQGEVWRGTSGRDVEEGTGAGDMMLGGAGADDLAGGAGRDVLVGALGQDTLDGGDDADLMLGGWGEDSLTGGDGFDILIGGARADSLFGGAGNDLLFGSSGADQMQGDQGNDYLIGWDVRADLSATDLLRGFVLTDAEEIAADLRSGFGTAMTESDLALVQQNLFNADPADMAADTLLGGEGADSLEGDHGDVLTGGAGVDRFAVYNEVGDTSVTITDFDPTTEQLFILSESRIDGTDLTDSPSGLEVRVNDRVVAVLQGITNAMMADANAIRFETEFSLKAS